MRRCSLGSLGGGGGYALSSLSSLMMSWMLIGTGMLIILTKWLDCMSTARAIGHPGQERNPIARELMRRYGVRATIWSVFGLTTLIVVTYLILLWRVPDMPLGRGGFLVVGTVLWITQGAVAHTNWTGRSNMLTRWLWRMFGSR
jgi:hypothetical protein